MSAADCDSRAITLHLAIGPRAYRDLQQPAFGERHGVGVGGDDEVVEHPYIYQVQCMSQAARKRLVGGARLAGAGRVVVCVMYHAKNVLQRATTSFEHRHRYGYPGIFGN